MYIIAKDGSGDFTSIQAAIDAAPAYSRAPVILLVRAGEYRERVIVNKDNIRIIGEDPERTVITHSGCAKDTNSEGKPKGTFLSYTFLVTGCNAEVENLTIRNDAGDGRVVGQAVAVYAAGDRGVWRNVRMIAAQDTLFCGPTMPKVAKDALPIRIPRIWRVWFCLCGMGYKSCSDTGSMLFFSYIEPGGRKWFCLWGKQNIKGVCRNRHTPFCLKRFFSFFETDEWISCFVLNRRRRCFC